MTKDGVVLCILDGWGDCNGESCDAIHAASKPFWESVVAKCPSSSLSASGVDVGLPEGQVGNSEVGHISIGSGRVVLQDIQRINLGICDVHNNPELLNFVNAVKRGGGVCHIMGLLSDGGVHSLQSHMEQLIRVVGKFGIKVYIHAFLDGRDVPPYSAKKYVGMLNAAIDGEDAKIATISGRYYAMDRDNRIERISKAYDAMASAISEQRYDCAEDAIEASYANGVSDEFFVPTVIGDYNGFNKEDGILLTNFRNDRVIQLLRMLLDRATCSGNILGMVRYSAAIPIASLFPPKEICNTLGEVVSKLGMKQLRIAETEKFAHVTFFFNGGREDPFVGEDRIIVPSPKVSTYDTKPEMSAPTVTDRLVENIESEKYDLIVVNYANADMVGHTGNIEAAKAAITAVDECLRRVYDAVRKAGYAMLITADHGNAERMFDGEGTPFTAHTISTVPFVVCNSKKHVTAVVSGGLSDVAPTVLDLMQLGKPEEMTGNTLLRYGDNA